VSLYIYGAVYPPSDPTCTHPHTRPHPTPDPPLPFSPIPIVHSIRACGGEGGGAFLEAIGGRYGGLEKINLSEVSEKSLGTGMTI